MTTSSCTPVPAADPRWLLLLFQIPAKPGYLRVKIRRRLQRLGAVAVKQAVYALPNGEDCREDFEWLRAEIVAGGGEASVCEAGFVGGLTDDDVEALFRTARETDYRVLAEEAGSLHESIARGGRGATSPDADLEGALARLRNRWHEIASVDFFPARGRDVVEGLLGEIEGWMQQGYGAAPREEVASTVEPLSLYTGRTWVTRRGVYVDRMASAWLIRRFVDPDARFRFVEGRRYEPAGGEVRFDMYEAEFTHEGDLCTFEVMLDRFAIGEPAVRRIAEIVHDLDLKDSKFGRPECDGIGVVLRGIAATEEDDEQRITRGAALFDELRTAFGDERVGPT